MHLSLCAERHPPKINSKMLEKYLNKTATRYIFFEMIPTFLLGLMVFIFVLLMFQALRLTEFVLIHGVGMETIAAILGYLSISFLPALFPMALLFAILMTYGRMSADSEMIALKASGLNMVSISIPAILLAVMVAVLSAQTSFHVAPWGNRQFELLIGKMSQSQLTATIREGVFSEGFFDKVVYANKVDSKSGQLSDVFIYQESKEELPLTIIAKRGEIIQENSLDGNSVLIRLSDGDIHRKGETHTKIKFDSYDIRMTDNAIREERTKSPPSLTIEEISSRLEKKDLPVEESRVLRAEWHKRWAISVVCVIFGMLGVGLGTSTNRRSAKSSGMILSFGVVILYWIIYVTAEGLARSGKWPAGLAIWSPNVIFAAFAAWALKKNWN